MRRFKRLPVEVVAIGLLTALSTSPVWAQVQAGSDGRALDANLQSGSGGFNPGGRRPSPGAYQDALITGNIGGLHRFRGDIDYGAPGEFSAPTAADDTYLFRLRSIAPTLREFQNPAVMQQRGGGPLLLRSGSGVTTGEVTGNAYRLGGTPLNYRRDDLTGLSVRRDGPQGPAALDAAPLRPRVDQQTYLEELDLPGRALEVNASPLMGVRRQDPLRARSIRSILPPTERTTDEDEPADPAQGAEERDDRGGRLALPPAVTIGEQLIHPDETPEARAAARRRLGSEAREAAALRQPGQTPDDAEDVYAGLLRRVRERVQEEPDRDDAPLGDRLGGRADGEQESQPRLSAEERLARRAEEELRAQRRDGGGPQDAAFKRLVAQLRYDLPPLTSLASGSGTRFDEAMAGAERLMSEGQYLQAEAAYARAMAMPQSTPLAMIGSVHAQIGAGLHAAAASGLRRLFTLHPELIAARYTQPVLPEEERLEEAAAEVQTLRESSGRPEIAMLSAYLAYQRGDRGEAQRILEGARGQAPQDALLPLLQKVWAADEEEAARDGGSDRAGDPRPGAAPDGPQK